MIAPAGKSCARLFVLEKWVDGYDRWVSLGRVTETEQRALFVFHDKGLAERFRKQFYPGKEFRTREIPASSRIEISSPAGAIIPAAIASSSVTFPVLIVRSQISCQCLSSRPRR